jgi:hypothetical protein
MPENKVIYRCSGSAHCPNQACRHREEHLARRVFRQVNNYQWCCHRDDLCPHAHMFVKCELVKDVILPQTRK